MSTVLSLPYSLLLRAASRRPAVAICHKSGLCYRFILLPRIPSSYRYLTALTRTLDSQSQSRQMSNSRSEGGCLASLVEADEAKEVEDVGLEFIEEPCGLPADQGFGYVQVDFGERVGPDARYEILRKLGWGMYSSVWLAKDVVEDRFVAIKALTGNATKLCKNGIICELDVLRQISAQGKGMEGTHCLSLLSEFVHPGKDEDGEHVCFVTDVMGPSVGVFRKEVGRFTKPLIKKMLRHTLIGLAHLHSFGIAHTDLRPENMLMDLGSRSSSLDIETFITEDPARRHPPERTWGDNKYTQVAVSQPFPIPHFEDWISRSFAIGDFGSAQFVDKKITDNITPVDLRAPEVILGLSWNEKVDIWSFGCLVFEFINNQKLIRNTQESVDPERTALWQILILTNERLPPSTIRSSPLAMEYLDPETGWLNDDRPRVETSILDILKQIGSLTKTEDLLGVEALLKKCLRLDPKDRLSAKEILEDPWLNTET